jgi:energy-coupling factor transporter ATP-binding protein EcfA2
VLRLLDKARAGLDLAALGLDGAAEAVLHRALAQPNGIVLVTGPTGSGKTTTLYAALGRLNDGARNILTVEDPVEYAIDGVGQTQVNPRLGLTFAAGLRAILRQDPDVVMVGEIRDAETAQIAVQAALTGHLVLATVHTNDAAGAITRLRDMGVEPFLLAATLRAVLAQRLVRRLCPHCCAPEAMPASLAATLGLEPGSPPWSRPAARPATRPGTAGASACSRRCGWTMACAACCMTMPEKTRWLLMLSALGLATRVAFRAWSTLRARWCWPVRSARPRQRASCGRTRDERAGFRLSRGRSAGPRAGRAAGGGRSGHGAGRSGCARLACGAPRSGAGRARASRSPAHGLAPARLVHPATGCAGCRQPGRKRCAPCCARPVPGARRGDRRGPCRGVRRAGTGAGHGAGAARFSAGLSRHDRCGESAGRLPQIAARLADLIERQAQVRARLAGALAYPLALAVVAVAVVTGLMVAVVPRVVEQFDAASRQLPWLTRVVIAVSGFLAAWGWAVALGLALGALGFARGWPGHRFARGGCGHARLAAAGAAVARCPGRCAGAHPGDDDRRAPALARRLAAGGADGGNTCHARALAQVAQGVREGGSLASGLAQAGLFPPLLVAMVASGEASGQLGALLESAADALDRSFEAAAATALALLEPAIIVVMGGIVALIILSILLPILQLQTLVGS